LSTVAHLRALERRIARIDKHIEMMAEKIVLEEKQVLTEQGKIEKKRGQNPEA